MSLRTALWILSYPVDDADAADLWYEAMCVVMAERSSA